MITQNADKTAFLGAKDRTMENTEDKRPVVKEKARNIICFFALGVLSLIYDEIWVTAAEDVLSGSKIATTNVIIAIALPVLAVKISAPWFIQKCSYLYKSGIVVFLLVAGLIVIVSAESVLLRLFGISIIESGASFSEITFLALTAAYEDVTVSAFVAGIGVSSLLGPLYYTGNYNAVITILFLLHIHLITRGTFRQVPTRRIRLSFVKCADSDLRGFFFFHNFRGLK